MNGSRIAMLSALGVMVALTCAPPAQADKIYWTDAGTLTVQRADLDGTNVETIVDARRSEYLFAITLAAAAGKLYWTGWDVFSAPVNRCDLDGGGIQTIERVDTTTQGLAVDLANGRLYGAQPSDCSPGCGRIWACGLDGADCETVVSSLDWPQAIVIDPTSSRMYWSDLGDRGIHVADLDGANRQLVMADVDASAIAIDPAAQKLYWADESNGVIRRAGPDGTNPETIHEQLAMPRSLAIDPEREELYWTAVGAGKIRRSKLDGSLIEDVVVGLAMPNGIVLELGEGTIPLSMSADGLEWSRPAGAAFSDVVWGELSVLRETAGDFAASTERCLASGTTETTLPYSSIPAGENYWFLVRGVTAATGDGTFSSFGAGQAAARDRQIAQSGIACR